jgi:hypothetical protein
MPLQFTRRQIAAALSSSAALLAQTPNPPLPQNPADELQAAREALRLNFERMDKFELPMATEPAVHFKP